MGISRCAVAAAALCLAACGGTTLVPRTPSAAVSTPSAGSAAGAMNGFLAAARAEDNNRVLTWLATTTDSADLSELLKVYSDFGATAGLFWEVAGVHLTRVTTVDATHANIVLSGDVVWCLGKAPNDPSAMCSAVSGVAGMEHTYAATAVDGTWKVDIDVNASSGLDHNPQASPTAGAARPTT
jgi:hypothetical protein